MYGGTREESKVYEQIDLDRFKCGKCVCTNTKRQHYLSVCLFCLCVCDNIVFWRKPVAEDVRVDLMADIKFSSTDAR